MNVFDEQSQSSGDVDASRHRAGAPSHDAVDRQAALVLQWQAAESRLYPLALADPDLYEAALTLVVQARDVLQGMNLDGDTLASVSADEVLTKCQAAGSVSEQGFDTRIAVDAARAQCWRAISQESKG